MNDFLRELLNLPEQASTYAEELDYLHYFIIGTTMAGATVVGLLAMLFAIRYRRRGRLEPTRRIKTPAIVEVGYIALLLTLFVGWWVIGYAQYLHVRDQPRDAMDIYVTAKQWMWKFAYPDGRESIGVLTVPAETPIRLHLTSRDVIHSFFVPAFRLKRDVLPGRYATAWFEADQPGVYPLYCAEYCGLSHSDMLGRVVVLAPGPYQAWLEHGAEEGVGEGDPPLAAEDEPSMAERGRRVAARHGCFACHTTDGQDHIGPTWQGLYGREVPLEDGGIVIADAAYMTMSMMDPEAMIHAGYPPVMPSYRGRLEPFEVAALLEFIKTLPEEAAEYPPLPRATVTEGER